MKSVLNIGGNKDKHIDSSTHLLRFGILYLLILLILFSSLVSDKFLTVGNCINVLRQASMTIMIALGMGMVIITGGIDLSVGSLAALVGVFVSGAITKWEWSVALAILFALFIGVVFGCLNGFIISKFNISPMIITLATMSAARGVAMLYNNGAQIVGLPPNFTFIGRGYILGGIPIPVAIMLALALFIWFIMTKTLFGKYLYAIGGGEDIARLAGINLIKTKIMCYAICSLCAAIAGVVYCARLNMGDPTIGSDFAMDAIASVVLGGISLYGGSGKILGAVVGALFIAVLANALNIIGVSSFWQLVVKAIVLIIAALIYSERKN